MKFARGCKVNSLETNRMKPYPVQLTPAERQTLETFIASGVAPARKLTRARILLKVDAGLTKTAVSQLLDVTNSTVTHVCRAFQSHRLAAIERKSPERQYTHCIDGEAEAHLIALACSEPPVGRAQWSLRLWQTEMLKRKYVATVSHESVRTTLKKTN